MDHTDRYDSESPKTDSLDGHSVETESLPTYESIGLLKGGREILIRHQGEIYRLRLTRNDKLILNK